MKPVQLRPEQAAATGQIPDELRVYRRAVQAAAPRSVSTAESEIFSATEALLRRKLIGDLTVADVLVEANVSRTTFYKYFTSKSMVVSAMLRKCQAELLGVMRPWSMRGEAPVEDALHEAMSAVAEVWARHRPVLRAGDESWHIEPEIGRQWLSLMDYFVEDISRQIDWEREAGVAPDGEDSKQIARYLAWGAQRLLYLAGCGMCGLSSESEVVDFLVTMWLGAIYKS